MICCVHVRAWSRYDLELWPQGQIYRIFYMFWHMGVSPRDSMLFTFLTLVWPWAFTNMWVAMGILSEFYSQFLSCYYYVKCLVFKFHVKFLAAYCTVDWFRLLLWQVCEILILFFVVTDSWDPGQARQAQSTGSSRVYGAAQVLARPRKPQSPPSGLQPHPEERPDPTTPHPDPGG